MTGKRARGAGVDAPAEGANASNGATATEPAAPAEAPPLNAIALAKEVVLERMQNLLEWLLGRLKRYRAGRGDWWDT